MRNDPIRAHIREVLAVVPRSYPDFVDAMDRYLAQNSIYQESFLAWLKLHPEADSSAVIRYITEELIPDFFTDEVDPRWFEYYPEEDLKELFGYDSRAEAAADTPGTAEYEARMKAESDKNQADPSA